MSRKKKNQGRQSVPFPRDMQQSGFYRSQIKLGDAIRTKIETDTSIGNDYDIPEIGQVVYIHPTHNFYVLEFPNGICQTEYFRHKPSLYAMDQKYKSTGAHHNERRKQNAKV